MMFLYQDWWSFDNFLQQNLTTMDKIVPVVTYNNLYFVRESSVIWPPKFRTDDLNQCLHGNWQLWGSRYNFSRDYVSFDLLS